VSAADFDGDVRADDPIAAIQAGSELIRVHRVTDGAVLRTFARSTPRSRGDGRLTARNGVHVLVFNSNREVVARWWGCR
jgi:hypothetical protein